MVATIFSISLCNIHKTEASIQFLTLKHRRRILLCDFVPPLQTKQKKVPLSSVLGLGLSPAPRRQSGLGAALAVRVRPRGAGV